MDLFLLNRIHPALKSTQKPHGFRQTKSTTGQILTVRSIIEDVQAKKLHLVLLFVDFSNFFDFIQRIKMEKIVLEYGISSETVATIMMLNRNTQ